MGRIKIAEGETSTGQRVIFTLAVEGKGTAIGVGYAHEDGRDAQLIRFGEEFQNIQLTVCE